MKTIRVLFPVLIALATTVPGGDLHGAELATGTVVSLGPQGMVVKTDKGDVPVPFNASTELSIRYVVKVEDLPDATPCYLVGGMPAGSKEFAPGLKVQMFIPYGNVTYPATQQFIALQSDGGVRLQRAPGLLRKGPPLAFQVGPNVVHRVGNNPVPPSSNGLGGKTFSLPKNYEIEIDFGNNLNMAGKDAKVTVNGDPKRPQDLTIVIDRTEQLDLSGAKGPGGGKK